MAIAYEPASDYCRIGSLENVKRHFPLFTTDYCRIGSLENERLKTAARTADYCRIGSLETLTAYSFRTLR